MKWQKFVKFFFTYKGYIEVLDGLKSTLIIAFLGLIIGIVIGTVIASIKQTTTVTPKADTGPIKKPRIRITISFGSYFKNSTLEIGILAKIVRIYAIAPKSPRRASFFVLAFIITSFIKIKKPI